VKEMQLAFFIFLKMMEIKASQTDDSKKKEIYGLEILRKLSEFIEKSYANKLIVTNLLYSKFGSPFPNLTSEEESETLLHLIVKK
jgi:hypothetical protein